MFCTQLCFYTTTDFISPYHLIASSHKFQKTYSTSFVSVCIHLYASTPLHLYTLHFYQSISSTVNCCICLIVLQFTTSVFPKNPFPNQSSGRFNVIVDTVPPHSNPDSTIPQHPQSRVMTHFSLFVVFSNHYDSDTYAYPPDPTPIPERPRLTKTKSSRSTHRIIATQESRFHSHSNMFLRKNIHGFLFVYVCVRFLPTWQASLYWEDSIFFRMHKSCNCLSPFIIPFTIMSQMPPPPPPA